MTRRQGMTLAVCTRNRHDDLQRCAASVARQTPDFPVQVMIVDDGDMPDSVLDKIGRTLDPGGFTLTYYRKQNAGLLQSRIESVAQAAHDVILFLDDDVELEADYLSRLADLYAQHPGASGIGGIDPSIRGNWKWNGFARLFLYDSGKPGRLSPSGYGGSMTRWSGMREPFPTEYLLGCNMSFRKKALQGLRPVEWLTGYSMGEDLYLSHWAGRTGKLWIDPGLRVRHYQSPVSRDKEEQVAYTEVVNHYRLLQLKRAGKWRYAAHLWTSAGLCGRAWIRRKWRHKAAAYGKAIRFVIEDEWRNGFGEGVADSGNGRPTG